MVKDADGNITTESTYIYDASGNIVTAGAIDMLYDEQNRLMSYEGQSLTYDADGNMTEGILNGTAAGLSYDSSNQLIQAGNTVYTYDAEGNRIALTVAGNMTEYVYDTLDSLSRLLVSVDASGNCTFYVYGIGLLGYQKEDGSYSIYHYDLRGSTTVLTDMSGNVKDRYTYGAYGNLEEHTGTSTTPFLYNGCDGVMTDSNGLYYLRARYYSPELMRFINADPLRGSIGTSEILNRYAYVNGNPVSFVDPFGTSAELADLAHTALDLLGILPGYGMVFDTANGLWYASEGSWSNAAISAASFLPVIGDIGQAGRVGFKAVDLMDDGCDVVKAGKSLGNGIDTVSDIVKGGLDDGLGIYASQAGHHSMAKSAFEGISQYDFKQALTVSQSKLTEFGVKHATITGQQKTLYTAFAKSGEELTMDAMRQIEIKAMTNAGIPVNYATNAVDKAIDALVESGVTNPSRIPWTK